MYNPELIQLLQREIRKVPYDIKAEPQVHAALERGVDYSTMYISCDSLFFREHNRDVVFTEIKEDSRKIPVLQVHLSRRGIFDHLPEGLFFQPEQRIGTGYSAADMAHDHQVNKRKEQEARRFFQPLEQDFFWQRIQLEAEEVKLLEGLQSGILNQYFIDFWAISGSIPKALIVPFIMLLPYAHSISGNLGLTAQCLAKLLKEKVDVKQVDAGQSEAPEYYVTELGRQRLGVDMVCGRHFSEDYPLLEFTIGPLASSAVCDYLQGGLYEVLLETFYRFFVPFDAGTITRIEVPPEQRGMRLQEGSGPVLGYSSVLC